MSDQHNTVSGQISNEDKDRFEDFREQNDLNKSQAVRRLLDRGLQYHQGWSMVRDIAAAAVLWAVASSLSSVAFNTPPRALSMFSIVFAGVILTAYGIYRVRWILRDR